MRSWNKRGDDGDAQSSGLSSLGKIIVVTMFLMFFFVVGSKLYAVFFGIDKDTMDSFNAVADNFELMLQRQTNFEYFTISFTSNDKSLIAANTCGNNIQCICIYKDSGAYQAKNPWKCRNFDPAKLKFNYELTLYSIRAPTYNENDPCGTGSEATNEGQSYFGVRHSSIPDKMPFELYPVAYFKMGFPYVWCEANNQYELYIEKFVSGDEAFLSVAENLPQETINNRIQVLSDCPSDSPENCLGVRRNNQRVGGGFCYYDKQEKKCQLIESFKECTDNKAVTEDCLCGSQMILMKKSEFKYCAYWGAGDAKKHYALPFDCSAITSCSDYCNAKSKSKEAQCDTFETQYCRMSICEGYQTKKCKPVTLNSGTTCDNFVQTDTAQTTPNPGTPSGGLQGPG